MKICKTDFSMKFVIAEIDGKDILVQFYDTHRKGVYNASVFVDGKEAKIISTYPGFIRRIQEAVLLIKLELKYAIKRISKRRGK